VTKSLCRELRKIEILTGGDPKSSQNELPDENQPASGRLIEQGTSRPFIAGASMYAEFSYDLVVGTTPNGDVITQILQKFDLKPNGEERKRCDLLSDTFICEIANLNDFDAIDDRLRRLRLDLDLQFNYTFSLRPRAALIKIRGDHNAALARQIVEA